MNQPSNNPYVKEHVTWDIHEIGKNILYLDPGEEYRYPWRLCVDEDLDWKLVETIYKNLYQGEPISWKSLKEFLIELIRNQLQASKARFLRIPYKNIKKVIYEPPKDWFLRFFRVWCIVPLNRRPQDFQNMF